MGLYQNRYIKILALSWFPVLCFHDVIGCDSEFYISYISQKLKSIVIKTLVSYCKDFQLFTGSIQAAKYNALVSVLKKKENF